MRFLLAALVFCFAWPPGKEFPPFHFVHPVHTAAAPAPLPEAPKLLSRAEISDLINAAAEKHDVPAAFITSIVAAESAFRSDAVSAKGAVGLMQVMPETAAEMGLDAFIPEENIEAGTKYLAGLIGYYSKKRRRRRDWLKHAIAAYNAGPGNVDKYRGIPPFRETRAYVSRVLSYFKNYQRASGEAAQFGLLARQ